MLREVSMRGMEDGSKEPCESSSFNGDSDDSVFSSLSEVKDDATSSSHDSSSPSTIASQLDTQGPLFQLSSLMAELPIKRGLSKYFQGKSQSSTSLSVRNVEDLAKKEGPCRKKTKTCKSYAGDATEEMLHTRDL